MVLFHAGCRLHWWLWWLTRTLQQNQRENLKRKYLSELICAKLLCRFDCAWIPIPWRAHATQSGLVWADSNTHTMCRCRGAVNCRNCFCSSLSFFPFRFSFSQFRIPPIQKKTKINDSIRARQLTYARTDAKADSTFFFSLILEFHYCSII